MPTPMASPSISRECWRSPATRCRWPVTRWCGCRNACGAGAFACQLLTRGWQAKAPAPRTIVPIGLLGRIGALALAVQFFRQDNSLRQFADGTPQSAALVAHAQIGIF